MADQFTEVTRQGWLSRISESIKGVLVGGAMVFVSFPLLWWNEGRSVQTYKSLQEGRGAVVAVTADSVDPAHDGKLVHVAAHATTEETLSDPTFGVSANALRLERRVEMYQWVEKKETKTTRKAGGQEVKETTYSYTTEWRDEPVASAEFRRPEDHQNPASMPYTSDAWYADRVTLGAFALSDALKRQIDQAARVPVAEADLAGLPADLQGRASIYDESFYVGADPGTPRVGDLRVRFEKVAPTDVSVIAQQTGSSFSAYQTEAGDALEMLRLGTVSADGMFTSAEQANVLLTWGLRLFGFLIMAGGFALIFRPLVVVADVIPLIGDLVGMGTGLVAFALAAPLSLVTIALAWVFYRPLLGVFLLAAAIGIFYWAMRAAAKRRAARVAAAAAPA